MSSEKSLSIMTSRVLFLKLRGCGACDKFQSHDMPMIVDGIKKDPELAANTIITTHVIDGKSKAYDPPLPESMKGIIGRHYPILIVLGPGEDEAGYAITNNNIYPIRVLSNGVIRTNSVKINVTPLSWCLQALRSKMPQQPARQTLTPPNRILVNRAVEYVNPNTVGRLRASQLSNI